MHFTPECFMNKGQATWNKCQGIRHRVVQADDAVPTIHRLPTARQLKSISPHCLPSGSESSNISSTAGSSRGVKRRRLDSDEDVSRFISGRSRHTPNRLSRQELSRVSPLTSLDLVLARFKKYTGPKGIRI